jgi:hypothetical protein
MRRLIFLALVLAEVCAGELFNGRDLQGWTTFLADARHGDPRRVFSVTNGAIRISGEGLGYLRTQNTYSNYVLRVEYRWGERNHTWGDRIGKARDSGIFLHATGPDGNSFDGGGAFMAAIECNVFQGATGDFLLIRGKDEKGRELDPRVTVTVAAERDGDGWFTWDPEGQPRVVERWGRINWRHKAPAWRDLLDFRGTRDVEKPGAWSVVECVCRGDSIEIRVNGVLVNRATRVWPSFGHILLQCEGSEIFFRRVSLELLER